MHVNHDINDITMDAIVLIFVYSSWPLFDQLLGATKTLIPP